MIPIAVSIASSPHKVKAESLMEEKTLELELPNVGKDEWIKLNPGAIGVYRVQYSPELLTLLLPSVADKTLPPLDRMSLLNDLLALVQSGRASTVDMLELMEASLEEDSYTVWNTINACLAKLNTLLSDTDLLLHFHDYGRRLLSKIHCRLGWQPIEGETHLDNLLRNLVINRLVAFEEPSVIAHSKELFESHSNATHVIPPDLRSAVYKAVAMDCDDNTFDTLFKVLNDRL